MRPLGDRLQSIHRNGSEVVDLRPDTDDLQRLFVLSPQCSSFRSIQCLSQGPWGSPDFSGKSGKLIGSFGYGILPNAEIRRRGITRTSNQNRSGAN